METKNNTGAIFKNDKKTAETHPDYKGKVNVNGKDMEVALWLKESKAGTKYFSATFQEPPMKEVTIGKQVWMEENLNVDKFRNGDLIPEAKTGGEWEKAGENKQPAWCYYNDNPDNGDRYGKLYNWFAVNDPRGLAPEGWKIPSDEDWSRLTDFLGGDAGTKMKSTSGWEDAGNGNNESGFSGLPGGSRFYNGSSGYNQHRFGYGWSSTENDEFEAWMRYLDYESGDVIRADTYKENGFSVRCLRD